MEMFVKLHVDPVRSGRVADMGPELWATLCVIASFMDADGRCYPTQASIGRMLGVNRQTANKYIQRLLAYRWRGEPVIVAERIRGPTGTFERNRYAILPASGLTMG